VIVYKTSVITAQHVLRSFDGRIAPILVALATLAFGLYLFQRESPWFAERV
jgi:hypothetical protein